MHFYRSPFGLAERKGLGRSALNNPQLFDPVFKLNLSIYEFEKMLYLCVEL
jgi:hypothetical protein